MQIVIAYRAVLGKFSAMKHILSLLALGALCSTASIASADCATGDWYTTGVRDGVLGRPGNYIREYARSCRRSGIRPNTDEWRSGYRQGIASYCTPQSAFSIGQDGRGLAPVCQRGRRDLAAANDRGLEWHELRTLREEYRVQSALALNALQSAKTSREKAEARRERQWFLTELNYIERRLRELGR